MGSVQPGELGGKPAIYPLKIDQGFDQHSVHDSSGKRSAVDIINSIQLPGIEAI